MEERFAGAVKRSFRRHFALKIALIVIVSAAGVIRLRPGDDLRNLYKPENELLRKETFFAEISGTASAPVMLVVKGGSEQEVLEKEEELRRSLDGFDYRAVSQAVPSIRKQEQNYALTEALYKNELDKYLTVIGAPPHVKEKMYASLVSQKDKPLTPAEMPKLLKPLLAGKNSVIVIENAGDKTKLARLAEEHGAVFSDRFQEISQTLKYLRERASLLFVLTCTLVFCAMALVYRVAKKALLMLTPSLLAVLMTLGILGFAGVGVSLFDVLALFLIVYIGADYVVFRAGESGGGKHTGVAVALSCLTSIISFGALGLTSFAVTKSLGLTLFLGLALSCVLSPLAESSLLKEEI
jgi:predicted exporter